MSHRFDDVACTRLAFCADHGGALGDAAQSFAKAPAPAHKGDAEPMLGDVVHGVGGCEDFGLVDVVYAEGFEDLENRRNGRVSGENH